MTLSIFHYHLQPGGVTGVIAAAGSIALSSLDGIDRLRLICGRPENAQAVVEGIRDVDLGVKPVELVVYPELGYVSDIPKEKRGALPRRLDAILADLSGTYDVWWVHNHHLGKNPAFTDALLRFARLHPEQRIVLQIHDFPESGRYQNLQAIQHGVSEHLYPVADNLRYAVLNRRDFDILHDAGIPEGRLFLLSNPVNLAVRDRPARPNGTAHDTAATVAAIDGPGTRRFHSGGRLVVYPVRCIRRKNVLEAALLCELASRAGGAAGWNLIVTLPGTSDQERTYSQMVCDAFDAGLVAGRFAPGLEADIPFPALMSDADAIISSSVQEGFGYTYLEAVAWGHPLIARYIDILAGMDALLSRFAVSFYRGVRVPFRSPSLSDMRPLLRARYAERLEEIEPFLPAEVFAHLGTQVAGLLGGKDIDFSFLLPQMQYTILKDLENEAFARKLALANAGVIAAFSAGDGSASSGPGHDDLSPLAVEFGHGAYAGRLRRILRSFAETPQSSAAGAGADARTVLSRFATVDYLRLLYGAM